MRNMKNVFPSIDLKRINNDNLNDVLGQFNNICITETSKTLNSNNLINNDQILSNKKYDSDFNSLPKRTVTYVDRPESENNYGDQNLNNYFKTFKPDVSPYSFDSKKNVSDNMMKLQNSRNDFNKKKTMVMPEELKSIPTQVDINNINNNK